LPAPANRQLAPHAYKRGKSLRPYIKKAGNKRDKSVHFAVSKMTSSSDDVFLAESVHVKLLQRRKVGVHVINRHRKKLGEYHHLFPQLKGDPQRFYTYMRMELATFDYILRNIEGRLVKKWANWHKQPIEPEERLVIFLR
jgi:hypothetical protein